MKQLRLILSVIFLALITGGSVLAEKIPQSQAVQVAAEFFRNSGHIQQNMAVLKTSESLPSLATKGSSSSEPRFYIIGNPNGEGFAIVSADDRFRQILGYSFEHSFDVNNMPANVEHWLSFLRDQMAWAEENNITDPAAIAEWKRDVKAGSPVKELSTPLWNQGYPYYNQCPMDGESRSLTGCVATAVSEVMRYHNWPESGNGVISGYTGESGVEVSARDLNHTYDWDNMPYTTSEFNTEAKRTAVATLMADVGAALRLDYSKSGTGGRAAQSVLIDNFGYASDIYYDFRDSYTDDEWIRLLKNEIDNNRPVIYDGYDSDYGGHCFVMDGYDDQNYFHVNWGWGGYDNGYFLISALNPSPYKFNNYQDALFGFKPGDGTYKAPEHWLDLYTPGLGCSSLSFVKNEWFAIAPFLFSNYSVLDFTGKVALFIVDKQGNRIEKIFESSTELPVGYYAGYSYIYVKIGVDIKSGYRIRAFYKPDGADEWSPMWRDGANPSIKQEILIGTNIVNVTDAGYATIYSDKQLVVPAGVQVFGYTFDDAANTLVSTEIPEGSILPANKGYVVKAAAGEYTFSVSEDEAGDFDSVLSGVLEDTETSKFSGTIYVLGTIDGKTTFYKYTGTTIPEGKAFYLKTTE